MGKFNPIHSDISREILSDFGKQLDAFSSVLTASKNINLNKTKASVSIAPWLRIKLCDLLRVVIYHNKRHFIQIATILKVQENGGEI